MKAKKFLLTFMMVSLSTLCATAQPLIKWKKSFGGTLADAARCIASDAQGNVYIAGYFQGTVTFPLVTGSVTLSSKYASMDIMMAKLDAKGNMLWVSTMSGESDDYASAIAVDTSGVYLLADFVGSVNFYTGTGVKTLTSSGDHDVALYHVDTDGNYKWAVKLGGNGVDMGLALSINANNIYIGGTFTGTTDLDPGTGLANFTSNANSDDAFVCKLNKSGSFVWAKTFGTATNETIYGMSIDASGNVYTTGSYFGTMDFDPGSSVANQVAKGSQDIFVSKLNASGDYVWAKSFGGTSVDIGKAIDIDLNGNVLLMAHYNGNVNFGTDANFTSKGSYDIFIGKLDSTGAFIWGRTLGGATTEYAYGIKADKDGNVYSYGIFSSTVDFDPGIAVSNYTSPGSNGIFVHKMNSKGEFSWVSTMGGTIQALHYGGNLALAAAPDNVYICGKFAGYYFLPNNGSDDAFVVKVGSCTEAIDVSITTKSQIDGGGISVGQEGAIDYRWYKCNDLSGGVIGGNYQTIYPVNYGSYQVVVNMEGCLDTSACVAYTKDVTGVTEFSSINNSINMYPNPANQNILTLGLSINAEVKISDAQGRLIHSAYFEKGDHLVDVSTFTNGVYMVRFTGENVTTTRILVVNR